MELFTNSGRSRSLLKWQCPTKSIVAWLRWLVFIFSRSLIISAEVSWRKQFVYFCPYLDCQCSYCFLFIQLLRSISDLLQASSGCIKVCSKLVLTMWPADWFPSIPVSCGTCMYHCYPHMCSYFLLGLTTVLEPLRIDLMIAKCFNLLATDFFFQILAHP